MNPYLLNNLRAAFLSTGFSPQLFYVLVIVACILILLCVVYAINLFIKKGKRYTSVLSVTEPQKVRELLTEAMTKRSRFEVLFQSNSKSQEAIHCSLMDIKGNQLILDIPFFMNGSRNLVQKNVTCYFHIPTKNNFTISYNFSSRTTSQQKKGQLTQIGIALPESIALGQKRNFLRVQAPIASTPLSEVAIIRLWATRFDNGKLQTNVKKWGESLLHSQNDVVWTENISQGGLRLVIQNGKKYEQRLKALSTLFIYFSVKKHGENNSLRYMTNCRIRSFYLNQETGILILGLQFLHQAKQGATPELVAWEEVKPEKGIRSIGDWAFLFHIYEHRSNNALNCL